jgi:hypothetical protein
MVSYDQRIYRDRKKLFEKKICSVRDINFVSVLADRLLVRSLQQTRTSKDSLADSKGSPKESFIMGFPF